MDEAKRRIRESSKSLPKAVAKDDVLDWGLIVIAFEQDGTPLLLSNMGPDHARRVITTMTEAISEEDVMPVDDVLGAINTIEPKKLH